MDKKHQKLLLSDIHKLVKILCVEKNTDLSAVSIQMGFTDGFISNIFTRNTTISLHVLYDISEILNCDIHILIPLKKNNQKKS
ncbi:MAG: hypothetical protein COA66_10275 [Arcobacter sp.]|nr:MAG: hypothetical protein COA66_10275 [Arcobacter sp.]